MFAQKGGELRKIKVKEVSIVGSPANRRRWLQFKIDDIEKAEIKLEIL